MALDSTDNDLIVQQVWEWISKIQYLWFGPVVQGDRAWEVSKTASLVASVWDIDRVATELPLSIMEYHRASGVRD